MSYFSNTHILHILQPKYKKWQTSTWGTRTIFQFLLDLIRSFKLVHLPVTHLSKWDPQFVLKSDVFFHEKLQAIKWLDFNDIFKGSIFINDGWIFFRLPHRSNLWPLRKSCVYLSISSKSSVMYEKYNLGIMVDSAQRCTLR